MKPRAALVWNPVAGAARDELPAVVSELEQTYELSVFETSPERDADACAAAALASDPSLVIAAGGDGTVSLVASRLIGGEVPLAVLPRGTANSFARALSIPLDLAGALENACKGQPHAIDTARAAGRSVLLFASVGFHAAAIGETLREAKNRWGLLAYIATGLQRIAELEPFALELETESEIIRCKVTNVAVANLAPLHTLFAQGPTAVCGDDGKLERHADRLRRPRLRHRHGAAPVPLRAQPEPRDPRRHRLFAGDPRDAPHRPAAAGAHRRRRRRRDSRDRRVRAPQPEGAGARAAAVRELRRAQARRAARARGRAEGRVNSATCPRGHVLMSLFLGACPFKHVLQGMS
ncbi:diacylglycerol kinase family protein [Nannocystis pusilla]|uniref:diacylglycerol kinase family protein n=1 Tax=Nannocystis pusilla TaxID=889268 RepID=UPI003DA41ADD